MKVWQDDNEESCKDKGEELVKELVLNGNLMKLCKTIFYILLHFWQCPPFFPPVT